MQPVLTPEQLDAVHATGNVLVVAGAGTGKTSTLVERCLAHLLDPNQKVSLEAILMVTFTEAAAAEIRQRLRARLERQLESDLDNPWLLEQLARIETARISTLHSFCLSLIRDHFYELGLDPELVVLSQDQADFLAAEKLDELLQSLLAGTSPPAQAVQSLVLEYARGQDKLVRALVLRLHHYTQTLIDPEGWLAQHLEALSSPDPDHWRRWLQDGLIEWRNLWLPELNRQPADNEKAAAGARRLEALPQNASRQEWAAVLSEILAFDADWPRGTKTRHRKPLARFYEDAAFLASLAGLVNDRDPLVEDWTWVRTPMATLVDLTSRFAALYATTKRELAAVDFHDLEQFALRLLWDRSQAAPTLLAQGWQRQLRHILVDEVQDINPAQDRILTALARAGATSNRFLVGDVKQSIYRFRLADPRIFQAYAHEWTASAETARVLTLTGNFRSHPAILHFVNRLFADILRPEVGGLTYTEDQWLQPGPTAPTRSAPANSMPVVELHWILEGPHDATPDTPYQEASEHSTAGSPEESRAESEDESSTAEREARLVARRIEKLMREGRTVIDRQTGSVRPLAWNDVAVLLRSPRNRIETYARVFAALGLPLQAGRGRFYESLEISDLVSLLQILDNPYQDIPLLTVLRSPLGGFTPDDLVCIRIAQRRTSLWSALRRLLRQGATPPPRSEWDNQPHGESSPTAGTEPGADTKAESWLAASWPVAWNKARLFLEAYRRWRHSAGSPPFRNASKPSSKRAATKPGSPPRPHPIRR